MIGKNLAILACIFTAVAAMFSPMSRAADAGLAAARIPGTAPFLDPESALWRATAPFTVTMLPQVITTPNHPNPAIKSLTVRAAHNGKWLGVLVEWKDPTKSDRIVVDEFGDQVAVEFPVHYNQDELPSPMMGSPGKRVDIWQWRAAFQRDIEMGEPGIRDIYPNTLVDVYPDEVLRATDARPYMGAVGADNLISHPLSVSPIIEQSAEGFGTLTALPGDQDTDGRGVWKDGTWRVVFTHPLTPISKNSARFVEGGGTVVAFAVWDGGNREVGARKAWAGWVPFRLAP
ncbi:MAG: hypothetical protein HYR49_09020 [Gammaproteobacteria bacterium]|nr:hypothetical protein [Gammaproteobacteria bacterium]